MLVSSLNDIQQQSETQQQMAAKRRKWAAVGTLILGLVGLVLACWQIFMAAAEPGVLEVTSSFVFFLLALAFTFDGFKRSKASR